ncbi:MAG: TetR/AcrR family transcriptional regulator [Actinocrinis sp.]
MATRMSAEDRREQTIAEAITVFARFGYEGATTAAIAKRVGVSQPYLFRLFPTKKDLFLAASARNMRDTLAVMREAAGGKTGPDALDAMGQAYQEKLQSNRDSLLMQLQTFAACYDEDIQRQTRQLLQELWGAVESLSGMPIDDRVTFFAKGMFCNVIAAAGRLDDEDDPQWAPILEALGRNKHVSAQQRDGALAAAVNAN